MLETCYLPTEEVAKAMTDALLELFRHKTWATLQLIGLEVPGPNGLDVWGYAEAKGQTQPVTAETWTSPA
jgi:hypothetical protein